MGHFYNVTANTYSVVALNYKSDGYMEASGMTFSTSGANVIETDYIDTVNNASFTFDVTPGTFGGGQGAIATPPFTTLLTHAYIMVTFP